MKTDPQTAADLAQLAWELLVEVEARTDPGKDILRKQLVEHGFNALRKAEVITERTQPRWKQVAHNA